MRRILVVILVAASAAPGCRKQPVAPQAASPRVVSFSPALTEMLFDMGMGGHVVGVTPFCRLPAGVKRPRVGDALSISAEAVLAVEPDLILAQTSPEKFKGVCDLDPNVRAVQFDLETLADVPAAMERIGRLLGEGEAASKAAAAFNERIEAVRRSVAGLPRPRVLFVMGTDRPAVAGDGTFVADLIEAAGGVNAGADIPGQTRWPQTHIDAIVDAAPDVIVCQVAEKGKADEARRYWLQWRGLPAARGGRVYAVEDPAWSIPSPALADLAGSLAAMIHSDVAVAGRPRMTLRMAWFYRLLAAAVVGAALAAAGMALQGLLRNPLAEPYILGISSGAGVGVLLGLALSAWYAVPAWASRPTLAFAAAVITCAVVYGVAQRRGRLDPYTLILSGVIVNAFNAAIMLAIQLYVDPNRIADFTYWAMGRLPDSVDPTLLAVCGGCVLAGWAVLAMKGAAFNVLGLGDQVAASSGVAVHRLRIVTFACVGLMTAAAVALAGPIAFLGLIVPHICRMFFGPDHRLGIVLAGVVGAVLLAAADALCRTVGPWVGVSLIPVGILTALSGGPFFIYLLRSRLREASR